MTFLRIRWVRVQNCVFRLQENRDGWALPRSLDYMNRELKRDLLTWLGKSKGVKLHSGSRNQGSKEGIWASLGIDLSPPCQWSVARVLSPSSEFLIYRQSKNGQFNDSQGAFPYQAVLVAAAVKLRDVVLWKECRTFRIQWTVIGIKAIWSQKFCQALQEEQPSSSSAQLYSERKAVFHSPWWWCPHQFIGGEGLTSPFLTYWLLTNIPLQHLSFMHCSGQHTSERLHLGHARFLP